MQNTDLLYTTTMVTNYGERWQEFKGLVTKGTEEFFDGSWGIGTVYHDVLEHFFEDTKFFKTDELSQAGECVAMGVRTYFNMEYYHCLRDFMFYNKMHGIEWNSWGVCIGQVGETADPDGGGMYPNDFNYTMLEGLTNDNDFEGYAESYDKHKQAIKYHTDIEKAVSYGYNLAHHLFSDSDLSAYGIFFSNVKYFLENSVMSDFDVYDENDYLSNFTWNFNVHKSGIYSEIVFNGCVYKISHETEEEEILQMLEQMELMKY